MPPLVHNRAPALSAVSEFSVGRAQELGLTPCGDERSVTTSAMPVSRPQLDPDRPAPVRRRAAQINTIRCAAVTALLSRVCPFAPHSAIRRNKPALALGRVPARQPQTRAGYSHAGAGARRASPRNCL